MTQRVNGSPDRVVYEKDTFGGSGGGGTTTADQGTAGLDPWLVEVQGQDDLEELIRPVRNSFSPVEGGGVKFNTSGDHVLWTPQLGNRVRVVWAGFFTKPHDTALPTEVYFELSGNRRFLVPMSFPFAFAHRTNWIGSVDDPLLVNLSATGQDVYINFELEEVTP